MLCVCVLCLPKLYYNYSICDSMRVSVCASMREWYFSLRRLSFEMRKSLGEIRKYHIHMRIKFVMVIFYSTMNLQSVHVQAHTHTHTRIRAHIVTLFKRHGVSLREEDKKKSTTKISLNKMKKKLFILGLGSEMVSKAHSN